MRSPKILGVVLLEMGKYLEHRLLVFKILISDDDGLEEPLN